MGSYCLDCWWNSEALLPLLAFPIESLSYKRQITELGTSNPPTFLLCNSSPESRDHLYFLCPYSWSLWYPLAHRCGLDPQQQWNDVTAQLQSHNSRNWRGRLILLTWQSCISWTWQERNSRLHCNTFRTVDQLTRLIDRQIRDKILSYRDRSPRLSSRMMQQWLS